VSNSKVSQKIKNFFRINSDGKEHKNSQRDSEASDEKPRSKAEKSGFRQSRFLPHLGTYGSVLVIFGENMDICWTLCW
jgi:protein-serine/threonine kinase